MRRPKSVDVLAQAAQVVTAAGLIDPKPLETDIDRRVHAIAATASNDKLRWMIAILEAWDWIRMQERPELRPLLDANSDGTAKAMGTIRDLAEELPGGPCRAVIANYLRYSADVIMGGKP